MNFKKISHNIPSELKLIALTLLIIIFLETTSLLSHQNVISKEKLTLKDDQESLATEAVASCKTKRNTAKTQCWDDIFENLLKKNGLEAAYLAYEKLYLTEPTFVENCHGFTHLIGGAAYKRYIQKQDFPVTSAVAYCSYGFFHGFIEEMMKETGSLDQARSFCDYIEKKLGSETWTVPSCMHGIGHGVTDGSDPRAIGDEHKLIDPGLSLCEKVGKNEYEIKLCATGVFNALAAMYFQPKYKLNLNRENPYTFCAQFTKSYIKHACYDDFKIIPPSLTGNNFPQAMRFVEAIPEDSYAQGAMDNLTTYWVYWLLKEPNLNKAIDACHGVQKRLQVSCITGLGAGLLTAGIPNEEYKRALEFCTSSILSDQEKDACHERIIGGFSIRYSKQKFHEICKTVEVPYKKYCQ